MMGKTTTWLFRGLNDKNERSINLWGCHRHQTRYQQVLRAIHWSTKWYQCPCETGTEPKISLKARIQKSRSIYKYIAIQRSIFQYHSAILTRTKPKTSLQVLDRVKQVFISTMLYRAVLQATIKLITPNWAEDCLVGGESKNGGISTNTAIQSWNHKYNAVSQS